MTEPRRVRTQVERDADGTAWRHHEHGERISDGRRGPLPPVPDCCYPPDAVDLAAPRRRWWHRYTRALAGRWLHVLTPGFLGELFNDVWSHMRHRYTRRTR